MGCLNEFVKSTSERFVPVWEKLVNVIYDTGRVPLEWLLGEIKPLYKKGDPTHAHNYRGITLLSCLGKLFTSILNDRLQILSYIFEVIYIN